MKLVVNFKKFTVIGLNNRDKFEFSDKNKAIGKLEEMGVDYLSIVEAFQDMNSTRNNVAYFGVKGTFMFSDKEKSFVEWH